MTEVWRLVLYKTEIKYKDELWDSQCKNNFIRNLL